MNPGSTPIIRAIFTAAVGIALLVSGCQPRPIVERPAAKADPEGLFYRAEEEFRRGDYPAALQTYERYVQQVPKGKKMPMALHRMGLIHYRNASYIRARELFREIKRAYPDCPELPAAAYLLAEAHYRTGDYESARRAALQWMEDFPEHPLTRDASFLLGELYHALKDDRSAFFWWLRALGEVEADADLEEDIRRNLQQLIGDAPLDDLREYAEMARGTEVLPAIYYRMASLHLQAGDLDGAKKNAMALVRSTVDSAWIDRGRTILDKVTETLSVRQRVIGCLLPLSGPFAIYGQEVLNGIQLGMGLFSGSPEEVPVELVIKDTGGKEDVARLLVDELVQKDKVMAIIGPLASKPAMAAAKRAQELGVPIITLTQKQNVTAEGPMVFRNFLTPAREVEAVLDRAMKELNLNRFGILYPDNSYGRFLMNLFWDRVEQMGARITAVESYRPDETDFAVQIKKLVGLYYPRTPSVRQKLREMGSLGEAGGGAPESGDGAEDEPIVDFDAIFIPDNYQQVALIAPQFPFHNVFYLRFLGTSLWQSPEIIDLAGDYVQGAIFCSGFFPDEESGPVRDFIEVYNESYESKPTILAATGYDTIKLVTHILTEGNAKTRDAFLERLHASGFYGLTGEISFDEQGEVVKVPTLLTVSGRQIRILQ
ncbi:MAG: penicillin-binding protein activator [Deltaproteobacteria bacterium]|nr:penicillin-binding protein activator [Deltaproteobacteria bacterium]